MVKLIALGLFVLIGIVALWVKGIEQMHVDHPDYKGEDFLNKDKEEEKQ
jgi:hypothetical protein